MRRGRKKHKRGAIALSHYQSNFITNIPFDEKRQSLKDPVKEKVGEVTYCGACNGH
jgi:hypothetical protein